MQTAGTTQKSSAIDATIGDIVAQDFRTAKVFENHGIDFCCGGKIPLSTICKEKGIDHATIMQELADIKNAPLERSNNYDAWALPFLADYIVNTHHAYLNENMGQIQGYADKIAGVHGANHPEVIEIAKIFTAIVTAMVPHLREEEEILFPAIRRIDDAKKAGNTPEGQDLKTITDTLVKLYQEHEEIGDAVHTIRHLSHEYALPVDACNTFAITYQKLKEFEDDLHKHVHLENNILFPKAAKF